MHRLRLRGAAIGLFAMGGLAWALACDEDFWDSVHFNDVPDFGMPPPSLVIAAWEESSSRPVPRSNRPIHGDYNSEWKREETRQAQQIRAIEGARRLEAAGRFRGAGDAWQAIRLNAKAGDGGPNSKLVSPEYARDREEVLREGSIPASEALRTYLTRSEQLRSKPDNKPAASEMAKLAASTDSGYVQAHAAYTLASLAFEAGRRAEAYKRYEAVATMPGPRQEPALMMAIRICLGSRGNWPEPENVSPAEIARGRDLIGTLLRTFPETRFRAGAEGWRMRADFLSGRRVEALTGYLGALDAAKDVDAQVSLLSSIRKVIESLKPEEARELRAALLARSELLQPYLDYRLYHTESKPEELASLVGFATEILARKPAAALSAEVEARLAEIAYVKGDANRALTLAERSLLQSSNRRADLATFVRSAAQAKIGSTKLAYAGLANYETKFKDSYLVRSALEQRALLAERLGKWSEAIDDFTRIDYFADVAYLLDVRMTVAQVEAYAKANPAPTYVLAAGYRQMRAGDFAGAAKWLSSIPVVERRRLAHTGSRDYAWLQPQSSNSPLDRIPDPLTSAHDLGRLSKDKTAKGMYALASYYYRRRNLLLYNASLWRGNRNALGWSWNEKIATPEDERARTQHHFEHECLYRAQVVCLELAKRYPKDPLAARALYRAATASRRLGSFNPWWRQKGRERVVRAADLLRRLYTSYPRDPLAKTARKYERVFRQEAGNVLASTLFEEAR